MASLQWSSFTSQFVAINSWKRYCIIKCGYWLQYWFFHSGKQRGIWIQQKPICGGWFQQVLLLKVIEVEIHAEKSAILVL